MTATEQQVMDELAEAIRNLLAYGSRYNSAAKAALTGYENWSKSQPIKVYCVECGAETETDCICDDLNFSDGERLVIDGEEYARVHPSNEI